MQTRHVFSVPDLATAEEALRVSIPRLSVERGDRYYDEGRVSRITGRVSNPDGTAGGLDQLKIQAIAVVATIVYSGIMTLIILMITKAAVGLRVGEEEEREGLDLVLHGEQIF